MNNTDLRDINNLYNDNDSGPSGKRLRDTDIFLQEVSKYLKMTKEDCTK